MEIISCASSIKKIPNEMKIARLCSNLVLKALLYCDVPVLGMKSSHKIDEIELCSVHTNHVALCL